MKNEEIQKLVSYINKQLDDKLNRKLESVYLVGSYPQGNVSESRPDINWLLVWKDSSSPEDIWKLGEVLTSAVDHFEDKLVVRPEFRPFKFSYPIKRGEKEIFVNISSVISSTSPEDFKRINSFIPEYVFAGFKATRKLIFGKDILKNIDFKVTEKLIQASTKQKVMSHKVQLDRIPLVYHLGRDVDLVYNESLSHAKNLMYFAAELLLNDKELQNKKFLEIYRNREGLLNLFRDRLPRSETAARTILDSKQNYPKWKNDKERTMEIYFAACKLSQLLITLC